VQNELEILNAERTLVTLNAEKIAQWFNAVAYTLYEMTYNVQETQEDRLRLEKYLRISPEDVYIGEAVEEKMKTAHEWANHDSVMVDGNEFAQHSVYLV
jgi:hypothetical protein